MRRFQKPAAIVLATVTGSGLVFLYLLKNTIDTISSVVDMKCELRRKRSEYIYLDTVDAPSHTPDEPHRWLRSTRGIGGNDTSPLVAWFEQRMNRIPWRILELIASSVSFQERRSWIKRLLSFKPLNEYDYRTLAQMCDAQTTVALARVKGINKNIFLPPRVRGDTKEKLVDEMHDLLVELKKRNKHWCLNYFINKAFPSFKSFAFLADLELRHGMSPLRIDEENILPMCVESLSHHCLVGKNVKDMIEIGGLSILMDAYYFLNNNAEVMLNLAKIIFLVSGYPEYLNDLFVTGWISVLAEWTTSSDNELAVLASSALANLDNLSEVGSSFKSDVLLLSPQQSTDTLPSVDVIMIHGILGGALTTWCSRSVEKGQEGLSRLIPWKKDDAEASDPDLDDFVVVLEDIPVNVSHDTYCDSLCWNSEDSPESSCDTECWPKDWLPRDCPSLRIIGVNYESRFTDWFSWCPLTDAGTRRNLENRASHLMDHLVDCDVGSRPIVFVCHSMGGIIVKHMLVRAFQNQQQFNKFFHNTKSVVFLSTPHFGSPLANLKKFLLLPSVELEELQHNSPSLVRLHKNFTETIRETHVEVVNFIEGSDTKVASLPLRLRCVPPPQSLSDPAFGVTYEIPVGHTEIAKLGSRCSFIYQTILQSIRRVSHEASLF